QFEAVSDKGMHLNLFLEATQGRFKNLVQRLDTHLLSENCLIVAEHYVIGILLNGFLSYASANLPIFLGKIGQTAPKRVYLYGYSNLSRKDWANRTKTSIFVRIFQSFLERLVKLHQIDNF
ncbi:MAG: hypothetical protein LKF43_10800, partial [Streptococcaceae bacterium]|nr:hypothetical protein [Streptococcaceae bacterium]